MKVSGGQGRGTEFAAPEIELLRERFSGTMGVPTVFRCAARATIVILVVTAIPLPGHAHDSWINKGGYRNAAGEWCCGEYDCDSPEQIASTGLGWVINGVEFVPFNEASPSPDGKVWICRRPDKTRRCVFGPPPNS
jgi:hypothetical protein